MVLAALGLGWLAVIRINKKEANMVHWRGKAMSNEIGMLWDEFAVGCLFGLLVGGLVMFGIMV